MLLIPAIDLKDGHCVRLKQGDMDQSTTFGEDPAAMARKWVDAGARRLHLVDLNGAFAGKPKNYAAIKAILKEVGSERASDLLLDSTPGQTGARLYSDHAHTRISAGFITDEREDGKAQALGEGVYACTDAAATLRAARGILQSAWPRLMAGGKQLDCMEAIALMEASLNLLKGMTLLHPLKTAESASSAATLQK